MVVLYIDVGIEVSFVSNGAVTFNNVSIDTVFKVFVGKFKAGLGTRIGRDAGIVFRSCFRFALDGS